MAGRGVQSRNKKIKPNRNSAVALKVYVLGEDFRVDDEPMDSRPGSPAYLEPQHARQLGYKKETAIPALKTHAHRGSTNAVVNTMQNPRRERSETGFG